jgi:SH3-like domain-containing protein
MKKISFVCGLTLTLVLPTLAQSPTVPDAPGGKTFPRYASLKKGEVNVRSGPGNQYPILWVYNRAGYPVQLLTRYDNYFKLKDVEGEEGWVYIGMVSGQATALVAGTTPAPLYRRNDASSNLVAKLAPGVVVELDDAPCTTPLCDVNVEGLNGYVPKASLTMLD